MPANLEKNLIIARAWKVLVNEQPQAITVIHDVELSASDSMIDSRTSENCVGLTLKPTY